MPSTFAYGLSGVEEVEGLAGDPPEFPPFPPPPFFFLESPGGLGVEVLPDLLSALPVLLLSGVPVLGLGARL